MRVLTGLSALTRPPRRAVVTVGMFDGVHRGHQRLIQATVQLAKQCRGTSVVMTFDPDPQQVLDPRHAQPRLMPLKERVRLIKTLGAQVVWIISFTRRFSQLSAEQFVQQVLLKRLKASCVVVGKNFAFGKARGGNLSLLRVLGQPHGMRVVIVPPVLRGGEPVSSSRIRRLIQQGELEEAHRLLGRPVALSGMVVHGEGRARQLGFPTANLRLVNELLLPRGVYQVRLEHAGRHLHGLMNLGVRPTFLAVNQDMPPRLRGGAQAVRGGRLIPHPEDTVEGSLGPLAPTPGSERQGAPACAERSEADRSEGGHLGVPLRGLTQRHGSAPVVCEVHLVGFQGNLYGRRVTLAVLTRLRAEKRFDTPEDLIRQIELDLRHARLRSSVAKPIRQSHRIVFPAV